MDNNMVRKLLFGPYQREYLQEMKPLYNKHPPAMRSHQAKSILADSTKENVPGNK
jgi:hypothetical protein